MSNMLSSGVSGLLAFQSALDTTSHNISNANTEGYSRQRVELTTKQPTYSSGGYVGNGVDVASVNRIYDDILATQVRSSSSGKSQWDIYSSVTDQVNNLLGDASSGLSAKLQEFVNAMQSVANSPSSSSERQVLISKAESLVSQLQTYNSRLEELQTQVDSQLDSEATTISGLASSIASLNEQIVSATGQGGNPPNDLLDKRDQLLDELSTHVGISTLKQTDGSVNVFIGSGQALVVGGQSSQVVTQPDAFDPTRSRIAIKSDTSTVDITDSLSGGSVGGLLDVREQVLDPAMNSLGRVAVTLSDAINGQQQAGMDLNGNLGGDMFAVGDVITLTATTNTGTGSVAVTRGDSSNLTTSNYLLTRTGSGWQLQRTDTGATVTMTGSGTSGSPFVADGMEIVVSGSAATGDRFEIRPTSGAVDEMSMVLTSTDQVAAAAPITASASSANTGNATITQGTVTDASNASLRSTVTIEFLSANSYTTDGGTTTNTYTSGQAISLNGWEVTITGVPADGDTFTVTDNTNGTGDNRNALLMADVLNNKLMDGGKTSISGAVGQWVADIGVKASQAESNLSVQTSLHEDNIATQQSVSGVNLDEEAADLLRYQQAYAAAAKVISTANTVFDSLMDAIR